MTAGKALAILVVMWFAVSAVLVLILWLQKRNRIDDGSRHTEEGS